MDRVNPANLPTTLPDNVIEQSITTLEDAKIEVLKATGQDSKYIKAKLFKNRDLWWDSIELDLISDDFKVRRSAQIEYNKLQARVLPTELTSPEDGGIIVKIQTYQEPPTIDKDSLIETFADPNNPDSFISI